MDHRIRQLLRNGDYTRAQVEQCRVNGHHWQELTDDTGKHLVCDCGLWLSGKEICESFNHIFVRLNWSLSFKCKRCGHIEYSGPEMCEKGYHTYSGKEIGNLCQICDASCENHGCILSYHASYGVYNGLCCLRCKKIKAGLDACKEGYHRFFPPYNGCIRKDCSENMSVSLYQALLETNYAKGIYVPKTKSKILRVNARKVMVGKRKKTQRPSIRVWMGYPFDWHEQKYDDLPKEERKIYKEALWFGQ